MIIKRQEYSSHNPMGAHNVLADIDPDDIAESVSQFLARHGPPRLPESRFFKSMLASSVEEGNRHLKD